MQRPRESRLRGDTIEVHLDSIRVQEEKVNRINCRIIWQCSLLLFVAFPILAFVIVSSSIACWYPAWQTKAQQDCASHPRRQRQQHQYLLRVALFPSRFCSLMWLCAISIIHEGHWSDLKACKWGCNFTLAERKAHSASVHLPVPFRLLLIISDCCCTFCNANSIRSCVRPTAPST